MTQTKTSHVKKRSLSAKQHLILMVSALVVVGAALIWLGWAWKSSSLPDHAVTVDRTFTGTVTTLSGDGRNGCVTPDQGGKPVCSIFAPAVGVTISQGAKVHAAREWADDSNGSRYDLLLIYPPTSP